MRSLKFLAVLISILLVDICGVAQQRQPTTATFRARRDRAMQGTSDALVLVRSRSSVMSENEDGFRQTPAFYYLTGLENAVGSLIVMDSRRYESWLFVPSSGQLHGFGRYMHPPYGYVESGQASAERLGFDHVVLWDEFISFIDRRLTEDPSLVIRGPFLSKWTSATPAGLLVGQDEVQLWENALRARWPKAKFGPMPDPVGLRAIKDTDEVAALTKWRH
ncbi:MAG TPA: aminopeptidase P N-terminal domain-containing protein [Pyrinomonadaceae bacterium]|jgi:hypothetical protein|nr:aminopeptidase P N-terminal domain-containing protein [Pyrinomonadaceae bacterium]